MKLDAQSAIYEHIVENKIESAIILEDDAIISHFLKEIVQDALNKVKKNYDLIFLDHGKAKSYPFKKKLYEGYRLAHYRAPSKKHVLTPMVLNHHVYLED